MGLPPVEGSITEDDRSDSVWEVDVLEIGGVGAAGCAAFSIVEVVVDLLLNGSWSKVNYSEMQESLVTYDGGLVALLGGDGFGVDVLGDDLYKQIV